MSNKAFVERHRRTPELKQIHITDSQTQDGESKDSQVDEMSLDDFFFQNGFSYTGLLEGKFDSVCGGTFSNSIAQIQNAHANDASSGAKGKGIDRSYELVNTSTQDFQNLTATGSCSGHQSSSFQVERDQPNENTTEETNIQSNNLYSEDGPWTRCLFENIELDEVADVDNEDHHEKGDHEHSTSGQQAGKSSEQTEQMHERTEQNERQISEKDVDDFIQDEESNSQEQNDFSIDESMIPTVGMQFRTREEAQNFFNLYAYAIGFSVAVVSTYRTASTKRQREVIRATLKCNKFGRNTQQQNEEETVQRQTTVIDRTGCKVEMVISEKNGVWSITNLCLDHNHGLSPQSKFFRSHTYMSPEEKAMIRSLRQANITTSKIVSVLSFLRGGHEHTPYNRKKVSNYGTTINRELKNSDVMQVVQFFKQKRAEDPNFYYSFQVDKNNKVKSVFWADAKSKSYYETCGDCISFDTTFLTNKYNLPFAPIVGVSPHGNTYLFACALIVNEAAKTFEWVFKEFLWAMGGKHPQTIITDQDRGMQVAISKVFPHSIHRSCLYHVKSKAEDKLCPTFKANEGLYEDFQDIIDNSLTELEFETLWPKMIEEHQVGHIDYFQTLWKNRKKFVPVYFKKNFFPFLQTTARSEGTNALFKRGVGAQYSMTSFLREYQRIMDSIHARENECEHNAIHKKVPVAKLETKYYIEIQAHELYNLSIFRKFQRILNDVTRLRVKEEKPGQEYLVFQAPNYYIKEHRPRMYVVHVDLENEEYNCICCKFEKDGLLCSHLLKVMLHLDIEKIPDKYIIDRWRKKHKRMRPLPIPDRLADNDTLRYNFIARRFVKTASKGATHKRKYEYLLKEMDRVDEGLDRIENELKEEKQQEDGETRTIANFANPHNGDDATSTIQLEDPDDAHTKGRPRMMTIREAIKKKKFYKCSHCGETSHTIKKCPNRDKVYNLPKPKKIRRKKTAKSGTEDVASSSAAPKQKRSRAKKTTLVKKTGDQTNNVEQQNSSKQSTFLEGATVPMTQEHAAGIIE